MYLVERSVVLMPNLFALGMTIKSVIWLSWNVNNLPRVDTAHSHGDKLPRDLSANYQSYPHKLVTLSLISAFTSPKVTHIWILALYSGIVFVLYLYFLNGKILYPLNEYLQILANICLARQFCSSLACMVQSMYKCWPLCALRGNSLFLWITYGPGPKAFNQINCKSHYSTAWLIQIYQVICCLTLISQTVGGP